MNRYVSRTAAIGAFALLLIGAPVAADSSSASGSLLDIFSSICFGTRPAGGLISPAAASQHHPEAEPKGVYMPMFSTPPKGGKVYNGPPLEDC